MSLFNSISMTLKRYGTATGYNANGEYVYGATTTSTISGTFQPAPGEATRVEEGGRRISDYDRIYTSTQIFPTQNKTGDPSDIIEYNGKVYEVIKVAHWGNGILPHYEAEVQEQKEGVSR